MGGIALSLMVLAVVYLDARALERADSILYRDRMRLSPGAWTLLSSLWFGAGLYYLRRERLLREFAGSDNVLPPQEPQFGVGREAAGAVILWLFVAPPTVTTVTLFLQALDEFTRLVVADLVATVLMVLLIGLAVRRSRRGSLWEVTGWSRRGPTVVAWTALALFFGLGWSSFVVWGHDVAPIFGGGTETSDPVTPLDKALAEASLGGAIALALVAVLVAPFVEELVFRGYLFRVLEVVRGRWPAFLLASLLFATLHVEQYWGDWRLILSILAGSLVLTALRLRSGSTLPSTVSHYAYNIGTFVMPLLLVYLHSPSYARYMSSAGELDSAEQEGLLLQSLEENPDNHQAMNNLAWLYAQEERELERALALVERALDLVPNRPAYVDTQAEVLYRMGRIRQAIAAEEWLVREHPEIEHYRKQLEKFRRAASP